MSMHVSKLVADGYIFPVNTRSPRTAEIWAIPKIRGNDTNPESLLIFPSIGWVMRHRLVVVISFPEPMDDLLLQLALCYNYLEFDRHITHKKLGDSQLLVYNLRH